MTGNGWKWPEIAGNSCKWLDIAKMERNGLSWMEIAEVAGND